ncbi:MAG: fused MFS/spermidine synthase, partial [Sciscionella sp.]|nr:fused MFS/spermidine synthase [Sciscionella sp.]
MSGEQRAVVRRRVEFGAAELIPDLSRSNGWLLTVDGVLQSYVDLADPAYLYMPYAQWVRQAVDRHWPAAESITAVVIGGGGFTVPRYLATSRPGSTLTVYELDGPLVELVREHLELDAIDGLRVRVRDGAKGLASTDDGGVDLVVQDAYRAG